MCQKDFSLLKTGLRRAHPKIKLAIQPNSNIYNPRQWLLPTIKMTINIAPSSNNPDHLTHPKYRADIDGLRAIAILTVVVFHAFPSWIKGGFVGVDIFFVISGYLISTIMIGSLERNSFSFVEFYIRRINRIFPALLLVLIASFAFGWFALLADEYKQLGKHIAGGAGFISNFLLWNESGYFDNVAETKPLLHLWSLGVEEQFYIIWPLLLWFTWKLRQNFLAIAIAVGLISFALNVDEVGSDTVAAFYSPQTRFWELMMGSILAYMTLHRQEILPLFKHKFDSWLGKIFYVHAPEANVKTLHNIQSVLGGVLIVIGAFVITKERHFPGWWAVLPTLGAVMIISAGAQAWFNRVVLSNRVLVWFGMISYPLYLWHWPLLSFSNIFESGTPSREIQITAVLISIALAWLTYRLIEKPIRLNGNTGKKAIYLFTLLMLVGYLGFNCFDRSGYSFRYEYKMLAANENSSYNSSFKYTSLGRDINDHNDGFNCISQVKLNIKKTDSFCKLTNSAPNLAIIGDSHSNHLFYGFKNSPNKEYNKVIVMGASMCHPALYAGQSQKCDDQIEATLNLISTLKSIKYVILSAYASNIQASGNNFENYLAGYKNTISALHKRQLKIIFIIDTPAFKESPVTCARNLLLIREFFKKPDSHCNSFALDKTGPRNIYNKFVQELKAQNNEVKFFDAYSLFCNESECQVVKDSTLLFGDTHHVTDYGSKLVVEEIVKALSAK
jgi:peptidoglycan/LPS O-acetylase OafA/YrhL